MNHRPILFPACLIALAAFLSTASAWAQTAPNLGTTANFGVLGGAGVTCTDSTITAGVGSVLTVSQTPTCAIAGTIHAGDAAAIAANTDFLLAYDALAAANPCPTDAAHNLSGDLGGMTLAPGVYCISGVGLLTSQLTLAGPSAGVWIFKAASSITPIGGSVVMANGAQACNVYWHTGTAVSLDATNFVGTILAGSAVTFTGVGSSLVGRALAKTAVTMTGTTISGNCSATQPPSCDKDHRRHKHCKQQRNDKPHCDGDRDGHDRDGYHKDGHDRDGYHKDGHHRGGHDQDDRDEVDRPWK